MRRFMAAKYTTMNMCSGFRIQFGRDGRTRTGDLVVPNDAL